MARALVLTGMHRSGTSLMASVVRQAGVDMGEALMPPGRGNRRGHFEDLEVFQLHERFLERCGVSAFAVPDGWSFEPKPGEVAAARELAARRQGKPVWGFKDPKAALFLDFWQPLLPSPFFLFIYRHPVEVVLSLLRRGLELEVQHDPRTAFRAWAAYNRRLLDFRQAHPERCLLWHAAEAARGLEGALVGLAERLEVTLDAAGAGALVHPEELAGLWARDIDWPELLPEAFELYGRLEAAADLPRGAGGPLVEAPARERRELLESNERLLASLLGRSSGTSLSVTASETKEYSRLRLLAAQQEEDVQGHLQEKAAIRGEWAKVETERRRVAERLRDLEREYARLRLLAAQQEEDIQGHVQEKEILRAECVKVEAERRRAAERLREMEEEKLQLEATGAWRAVRSYWSTIHRMRAWGRRLRAGLRGLPDQRRPGGVSDPTR